jgi:hypothetical protein
MSPGPYQANPRLEIASHFDGDSRLRQYDHSRKSVRSGANDSSVAGHLSVTKLWMRDPMH